MKITKAILHILDKDSNQLIVSQSPLVLSEFSVKEYLNSVTKRLDKGEFKYGVLSESSEMMSYINGLDEEFVSQSQHIAQMVFDSMAISEDTPSGDLLVCILENDKLERFFCMIKFNYKPSYTHMVTYEDDMMLNNIILNKTIFPSTTQKIEECVIVNLDTKETKIIEKKYSFEGQKRLFFTERLLQIDPTPTVSEKLKIVKKAVKEVGKRYNEDEYISMSQTQQAIFESIESEGIIDTEKVAEAVFKDNHVAKDEYREIITQTKFTEDIPENIPKYEKKYSKQKFKLDNGIELSIPSDVFNDQDTVEFINNPDGTISVIIKNIEDIMSRF